MEGRGDPNGGAVGGRSDSTWNGRDMEITEEDFLHQCARPGHDATGRRRTGGLACERQSGTRQWRAPEISGRRGAGMGGGGDARSVAPGSARLARGERSHQRSTSTSFMCHICVKPKLMP